MLPLDRLVRSTSSKIVFLLLDGLGGLPHLASGKTELETAQTPNLDKLAAKGSLGLIYPVAPGITPGSAPGHLALLGYDPLKYDIGRGVLEALGVDFDLQPGDMAARGNFCRVDERGIITDRRAGRLPSEQSAQLCKLLSRISVEGAEVFVCPVKEHRFALILRGQGLQPQVSDTDPQKEGLSPLPARPLSPGAERTAHLANSFIQQARELLLSSSPANMVLLRGFSQLPSLPPMSQLFQLRPAAIAAYPMYRGLAKVLGMTVLPTGATPEAEVATLSQAFAHYDFLFLHIKGTDLAGEDGDFDRKVKVIEEVDRLIPQVVKLNPDVIVVTGDHSTPALLRGHSWHPVPFLLFSPWSRGEGAIKFGESACARGSLGLFPALQAMPLILAHAQKLVKFGA